MPAPLPYLRPASSTSVRARRNDGGHFFKSRYLMAPDPSTLIQPKGVFIDEPSYQASALNSPSRRNRMAPRSIRAVLRKSPYPPISGVEKTCHDQPHHNASFPHPPTLVDILRMEPELSFSAAIERASDMNEDCRSPKYQAEAYEPSYVLDSQAGVLSDQFDIADVSPVLVNNFSLEAAGPTTKPLLQSRQHVNLNSCSVTMQDAKNAAIASWVSNYLYVAATRSYDFHGSDSSPSSIRSQVADDIYDIISTARLKSSTVFLALWYLVRLPRSLIPAAFGPFNCPGYPSERDVMVGMFMAGSILANIWQSDFTLSSKNWHQITSLPLRLVNSLERHSLAALDFNIYISPHEWHVWLMKLSDSHSSASPHYAGQDSEILHTLIGHVIQENIANLHDLYSKPITRDQSLPPTYAPATETKIIKNTSADVSFPDPPPEYTLNSPTYRPSVYDRPHLLRRLN